MSPPRFYAPQLSQFYNSAQFRSALEPAEARHAASVLRIRPGHSIELFDGTGHQALASVLSVSRNEVEYEVQQWSSPAQELTCPLTLAIALPKGDRQKTLIDAATELGVSKLVPLLTERGVAQPTDSALDRLTRGVIEACKQSGRNRLMEIASPCSIDQLIHEPCSSLDKPGHESEEHRPATEQSQLKLIAHPYSLDEPDGGRPENLYQLLGSVRRSPVTIIVGPEGGLSDDEVRSSIAAGWRMVSLGSTILRIEIAALSVAAQLSAWLQRSDSN